MSHSIELPGKIVKWNRKINENFKRLKFVLPNFPPDAWYRIRKLRKEVT